MPTTNGYLIVDPGAAVLSVEIQNSAGSQATTYTTRNGSSAHANPNTAVSAVTEFHVLGTGVFRVISKLNGATIDDQTVQVAGYGPGPTVITPTVSAAELPDVLEGLPVEFGVAVGDETTVVTTGTAKVTFRMPFAMTVTAVRANVNTASSASGPLTVDINEAGVSILSTKLTIDDSEKTSTTAASAPVISDPSLADDAEVTIDVDTAGTGAKGLKIWLIGTRA